MTCKEQRTSKLAFLFLVREWVDGWVGTKAGLMDCLAQPHKKRGAGEKEERGKDEGRVIFLYPQIRESSKIWIFYAKSVCGM